MLQSALTDSRRHAGGELLVCFVDLTNAFGSLSHSFLWGVLAQLGLEPEALLALQSIYDSTTTVYNTALGASEPAPVMRVVRQDCLLAASRSPVLGYVILCDNPGPVPDKPVRILYRGVVPPRTCYRPRP